jgi:hypothetical protein
MTDDSAPQRDECGLIPISAHATIPNAQGVSSGGGHRRRWSPRGLCFWRTVCGYGGGPREPAGGHLGVGVLEGGAGLLPPCGAATRRVPPSHPNDNRKREGSMG